ncbi:MAG: ABC transporter substrate-binding protein [Pyrinomonadaceae bacterium]
MLRRLTLFGFTSVLFLAVLLSGCNRNRGGGKDFFAMTLEAKIGSTNPLKGNDAASERLRQLMFNSLVKKTERFDYTGDLAADIQRAPDGLSYTFKLRDGIKFHDAKPLTSADVKYTFDKLLASSFPKAASFHKGAGEGRKPYIAGIDTPDQSTVVFRLNEPWLELLANLVPVPVIPEGTFETQEQKPLGTGPFKFANFDSLQDTVNMEAYESYWEGAPAIKRLRVRVIPDANTQVAELQTGGIDLAVNTALSPDTYVGLGNDPNLKVEQSPGVNIQYLGMNTESAPLNDARVRRAVAYAVDRESLVRNLLQGQARVAHSMIPQESWAYAAGQTYSFDQQQAKRLLDEAGFRDRDGDGPGMRFEQPLVFKISATNTIARQSAGVIQNALREIGVPASIETLEDNTLRDAMTKGQYQLTIGRWVGGNQDPIFLRDLFTNLAGGNFNRSRFNHPELNRVLGEAVSTADRDRATALYRQAQEIISREMPTLPLWYPNNIVVARRAVGNIKVDPSGDWKFVRLLTVEQ